MGEKTNVYVSLEESDNIFINNHLQRKKEEDKTHYTKNQIIQLLIRKGIDVENERYIKVDSQLDKFISQLQKITIEKDGKKFIYEKSKQQVYMWLIEKGLEHLED